MFDYKKAIETQRKEKIASSHTYVKSVDIYTHSRLDWPTRVVEDPLVGPGYDIIKDPNV